MSNHVLVPLVLYCQRPLVASAVWEVMAMPARELALLPPETVSVASEKAEANKALTVLPVEVAGRLEVIQVGAGVPAKVKLDAAEAPVLELKAVVPVASLSPQ